MTNFATHSNLITVVEHSGIAGNSFDVALIGSYFDVVCGSFLGVCFIKESKAKFVVYVGVLVAALRGGDGVEVNMIFELFLR